MTEVVIRPAHVADADAIFDLVRELAVFENELHKLKLTVEDLRHNGWGPAPAFEALMAEMDGRPVGFVMVFRNFSTWEGRAGLYVEDLFVREEARRFGVGRKLLAAVARLAVERGCRRIDLNALHWNPARAFYEKLGFRHLEDWLPYRLSDDAIAALACS